MSYKSKPEDYTLGSQPENKEKNRAPDILPGFFLLHIVLWNFNTYYLLLLLLLCTQCFIITRPLHYCQKTFEKSTEINEILQKRASDFVRSRTVKTYHFTFKTASIKACTVLVDKNHLRIDGCTTAWLPCQWMTYFATTINVKCQ